MQTAGKTGCNRAACRGPRGPTFIGSQDPDRHALRGMDSSGAVYTDSSLI